MRKNSPSVIILERPKSAIFTLRFWSKSKFSGFRSRWTTLCRWQYSTPDMICWKNRRALSSVSWKLMGLLLHSWFKIRSFLWEFLYTKTERCKKALELFMQNKAKVANHTLKASLFLSRLSFRNDLENRYWMVHYNFFTYFSMFNDVIKQFSTRYIFHHHKNICRCGNNLIQLDDMRMPKQF